MKAAINSCPLSATHGCTTFSLAGHPQVKAQRSSKRRRVSRTVHSSRELKPHNPDNPPLSEALQLAQQGDAAAFEFIYRLHCRRVYALCLRMVRDPSEAEDLAQEAFMQLFRKIHTFQGESAFSSWLYRLTPNIVLMRLRKKKPMSISLDRISTSDEENDGPRNDVGGPDLRLTGLFDRVNIQEAIDELPGFQSNVHSPRCPGLPTQRDRRNSWMLDRKL